MNILISDEAPLALTFHDGTSGFNRDLLTVELTAALRERQYLQIP